MSTAPARIALMQRYLGEATAEIEILKIERDAAAERAFRASEAHAMTMQRAIDAEAQRDDTRATLANAYTRMEAELDAALAQLAALRKAVIQVARCADYAAALSGDIA